MKEETVEKGAKTDFGVDALSTGFSNQISNFHEYVLFPYRKNGRFCEFA